MGRKRTDPRTAPVVRRGDIDRTGTPPEAVGAPVVPEPHPFPDGDARTDVIREGMVIDPSLTPTPDRNTPVSDDPRATRRGGPTAPVILTPEQREQLKALAAMHCTVPEMAAFLGISRQTLERNYTEVMDAGREVGKVSLRRAQYRAALNGNVTMMIWLGKQMLGQAEKIAQEISGPNQGPMQVQDVSAIDVLAAKLGQVAARVNPPAPTTGDGTEPEEHGERRTSG